MDLPIQPPPGRSVRPQHPGSPVRDASAPVHPMRDLLHSTLRLAAGWLDSLPTRPVGPQANVDQLRQSLCVPLPDQGVAPEAAVTELARLAEPGLVASAGPRYFGFVIGGSTPASLAADWLTSAWDQNAHTFATPPAAADSWATDAHKWLNVPYDSGLVFIADPSLHLRLKSARCAYSGQASVLNDVVLNQVLLRVHPPSPHDPAQLHSALAATVQSVGRCWLGATSWLGRPALRLSVSNWSTNESSIDDAILPLRSAISTHLP